MTRISRGLRQSGFTLLEVMVAMLLLTGAFLAVAQLLVVAGRAAADSRTASIAAALAAQKLEQLRALAWAYDVDGTPLDELGLSPPDTLAADVAGFVDYMDDAGAWIGSGRPPPAKAMFIRRWAVEADGRLAPATVRTFRVVVLRRWRTSASGGGSGCVWTEAARVVSAKARRSN
jgi:prepilin-type N-terminal cleavage/methylation domain-containing protein